MENQFSDYKHIYSNKPQNGNITITINKKDRTISYSCTEERIKHLGPGDVYDRRGRIKNTL